MPRIEHIIAAVFAIWAMVVIVRHAGRSAADQKQPSWAVRTLNSLGANVEAKRLLPAVGELTGRSVVAAAGKTRDAVSARVADVKAKRAEAREARDERMGVLGERARDTAARIGQATVDAMGRRWNGRDRDARMVSRPGQDDGDAPLQGDTDCPGCGARVKGVIPATEQDHTVTCGCGRRITFYRAPNDPPDEAVQDEAATDTPDQTTAEPSAKPRWQLLRRFVWWRRRPQAAGEQAAFAPNSITDQPQPAANIATSTDSQEDSVTATDERKPATADHPGRITITTPGIGGESSPRIPAPPGWRAVAAGVSDFNPDDDSELINFMAAEIAGMCAYSAAYEQLFQTCTGSLGLDPRSVQGLGEFGERIVEMTQEMARTHKRFVAFYEEVMKFVGEGGVMPHNGRFFSGNVAV